MGIVNIGIGAIITNKNNSILLLRKKKLINNTRIWTIPGGRLVSGESPYETLKRECYEETGLEIMKYKLAGFIDFYIGRNQWISLYFHVIKYKGKKRLLEMEPFDKISWHNIKKLPNLDLITSRTLDNYINNY